MVKGTLLFVILLSLMAITSKLRLMESRRHPRLSKCFEREYVFKWKSDKVDLLFNLFKGFISCKS